MDAAISPQLPSECGRQQHLPARRLYCELHQWLDSHTHCLPLRRGLQGCGVHPYQPHGQPCQLQAL